MHLERSDALLALGLSHRKADVALRERFALGEGDRAALRRRLEEELGLRRAVILSTCNRTEVYAFTEGESWEEARFLRLRELVFPEVEGDLVDLHRGWAAVIHLFRLAAGLDSMVVGESEILGQIKIAFEESASASKPGRVLQDLFRQAVTLGKRVRTDTRLGEGSLSVAAVAVKLARKVVGQLAGRRALILGAGETGELVARHLVADEIGELVVLNRTVERAERLVAALGGRAAGLEELEAEIDAADLVIGALERERPLVTPEIVRRVQRRRRAFIDVAVPRCIDPAVAEIGGVFAVDLDDIAKLVESNRDGRLALIREVDDLVVSEVHKFLSAQAFAGMTPLVQELRGTFDRVRDETTAEGKQDLGRFPETLTKRLLGATLDALKLATRDRYTEDEVRMAYESFLRRESRK